MTDDPREILKAAGVECAEVDEYFDDGKRNFMLHGGFGIRYIRESKADKTILALFQLVAKYKAERDDMEVELKRKHVRWRLHMAEQSIAELSEGRDDA